MASCVPMMLMLLLALHLSVAVAKKHPFSPPSWATKMNIQQRAHRGAASKLPVVSSFSIVRGGGGPDDNGNSNCNAVDLSYDAEASNNSDGCIRSQSERVVRTEWNRYLQWKQVASKRKSTILFYQRVTLGLLVTGAGLQTLALNQKQGLLHFLGASCVGATPLISSNFLTKKKTKQWSDSRWVSEETKAEVFKFRAGLAPYDSKTPHSVKDNARLLRSRGQQIRDKVEDDPLYALTTTVADNEPTPPHALDQNGYIESRLQTQMRFYREMAHNNAIRSSRLKFCQHALLGGSSFVSFMASAKKFDTTVGKQLFVGLGSWSTALTTMAGAVGAFLISTHLDDIAAQWTTSADDLDSIYIRDWSGPQWRDHALECEEVVADSVNKVTSIKNGEKVVDEAPPPVAATNMWKPDIMVGDETHDYYPASARAKWLETNKGMSEEEAKQKVMKEFPAMFSE